MTLRLVEGKSITAGEYDPTLPVIKPQVECAGAVILIGRGMVVLVRPLDSTKNEWLLPKGHVEQGESLIDAAKREALEETGAVCAVEDPGVLKTTTHETTKEIKTTSWFLLRAAALKTERAEVIAEAGNPRRHIGIFPLVVGLARLTFEEHRDVLATVIGGEITET